MFSTIKSLYDYFIYYTQQYINCTNAWTECTRETIVEALGGHPLAILLYDASTPLPETNLDVRAYVDQVVLGEASADRQCAAKACGVRIVKYYPPAADRTLAM